MRRVREFRVLTSRYASIVIKRLRNGGANKLSTDGENAYKRQVLTIVGPTQVF